MVWLALWASVIHLLTELPSKPLQLLHYSQVTCPADGDTFLVVSSADELNEAKGCTNLERLRIDCDIPERGCCGMPETLRYVEIGKTCRYIGNYAFDGLTFLYSIEMVCTDATIKERAFENGYGRLTDLIVHADDDGVGCFRLGTIGYCQYPWLVQVKLESDSEISQFNNGDGFRVLEYIGSVDATTVELWKGTTKWYIPEHGEDGRWAYTLLSDGVYLKYNTEMKLCPVSDDTVYTEISTFPDDASYAECSQLRTVYISTDIPSKAFYELDNLETVSIQSGCTRIGEYAFYKCSKVKVLDLPSSVSYIGDYAFAECTSVWTIKVQCPSVTIGTGAFENAFYSYTDITLYGTGSDCSYLDLGNVAGDDVPYSLDINLNIQSGAGWYNTGVKVISFSNIDYSTKTYWNGLQVRFTGSINGYSLDANKWRFEVTDDGVYIYYTMDAVSGECPTNEQYHSIYSFDYSDYTKCGDLMGVYIEAYEVPSNAFYLLSTLQEVEIGHSCRKISSYAFYRCSALNSLYISSSVESIGAYAFAYCSNLHEVMIPESCTYIGESAFYQCELTDIWINSTSITIEYNSFLESFQCENPDASIYIRGNDRGMGYIYLGRIYGFNANITLDVSITSNGDKFYKSGAVFVNWTSGDLPSEFIEYLTSKVKLTGSVNGMDLDTDDWNISFHKDQAYGTWQGMLRYKGKVRETASEGSGLWIALVVAVVIIGILACVGWIIDKKNIYGCFGDFCKTPESETEEEEVVTDV